MDGGQSYIAVDIAEIIDEHEDLESREFYSNGKFDHANRASFNGAST